jgi:septum site-determining protein MinC
VSFCDFKERKPEPEPVQAPAPDPAQGKTLVIDRPVRAGQQVYAREGDLVVLAAVSSGAELIADGDIHIYAPMRGRAATGRTRT